MIPDRAHEAARSGWCLCNDHERCAWSGCGCSCHWMACDACPFHGCEGCQAKGGE